MRLLLIDNYDSFVYNLAQAFGALGAEPVVVRNDVSMDELEATHPDALVVSPGPGSPDEAGVSVHAIRVFGERIPVLGVCLGHQCIGSAFGAEVVRAPVGPRHGKTSPVTHDGAGLFANLASPTEATRYHSLVIKDGSVPAELVVSARSDDGTIMGVRHARLPVEGVQFHPESVLSDDGDRMIENFLRMVESPGRRLAGR